MVRTSWTCLTQSEYDSMVETWETSINPKRHTFVVAAIVGSDMTMILVDRQNL